MALEYFLNILTMNQLVSGMAEFAVGLMHQEVEVAQGLEDATCILGK